MKIGVFDSGKGGTVILEAIEKKLPHEEYMYIGDSENCPYGEKTEEELMEIVCEIVDRLVQWGAKIIVIACNTATTRCIDKLRDLYSDLVFIGTEPAVKIAVNTGAKNVLVMATPGTIHSERMMSLVKDNQKQDQTIDLLACAGLADAIEKNKDVDVVLDELIGGVGKYDVVVLGCTHYALIKKRIQKYFPGAILIDGSEGVANRVNELVSKLA